MTDQPSDATSVVLWCAHAGGRACLPVIWDAARAIARGRSDRSGRHRRTTSPA